MEIKSLDMASPFRFPDFILQPEILLIVHPFSGNLVIPSSLTEFLYAFSSMMLTINQSINQSIIVLSQPQNL